MREDIAGPRGASSRPMWETPERMVMEKAQEFIQQIMEEQLRHFLLQNPLDHLLVVSRYLCKRG